MTQLPSTYLDYSFSYTEQGLLKHIQIYRFPAPHTWTTLLSEIGSRRRSRPGEMTAPDIDPWFREEALSRLWKKLDDLPCGITVACDQVGTPKVFRFEDGRPCKVVQYDSFGNKIYDNFPEFFIPVGFAGGLVDKDTGLVRFGYRDYDPTVGRFTALDPLGDTGGDHDLYEYCVDDPVSMNDPTGLFPPLIAALGYFLAGMAGTGTVAAGGTYIAANAADTIGGNLTGKETDAAVRGVKKVAPCALKAHLAATAGGFAPAAAVAAAPKVGAAAGAAAATVTTFGNQITNTAQRVAAAVQSSPYASQIEKYGSWAAQAADGTFVPVAPRHPSTLARGLRMKLPLKFL